MKEHPPSGGIQDSGHFTKKNFITNASFSGCHNSNSYTQQLAQTLLATLPRKDPWSTISIPATLALVNVATTPEINAETATLAT
jgi:hypothetical protein